MVPYLHGEAVRAQAEISIEEAEAGWELTALGPDPGGIVFALIVAPDCPIR